MKRLFKSRRAVSARTSWLCLGGIVDLVQGITLVRRGKSSTVQVLEDSVVNQEWKESLDMIDGPGTEVSFPHSTASTIPSCRFLVVTMHHFNFIISL